MAQLEVILGGRIKEIHVQFDKLCCEASEARSNWKRIEGALRGQIKYMEERISDDIDRDYVEDTLRSKIKELEATLREREAANKKTLLGGMMNFFKGKESDREMLKVPCA
jgi:hypothetical protein